MSKSPPLKSPLLHLKLIGYQFFHYLMLIPILIYLWIRGRRDNLYKKHVGERFGFYHKSKSISKTEHVWVHAVSLGELRSAVPLIKALLRRGEKIVTTHFTPAGRREALSVFEQEIARGQLTVVYLPLEYGFAFRRFYRHFKPKYGLVMEVEFWPCMIISARKSAIPLFLCNGQYPTKSFNRDTKGIQFRSLVVQYFAGVMVKSELQADRFASLGVANIAVTGELRFEQPIPSQQLLRGTEAREILNRKRIFTIASAVAGEDDTYIKTICAIKDHCYKSGFESPLFIYVPRAPERFDEVKALLQQAGLAVGTRQQMYDKALTPQHTSPHNSPLLDVLLGNSMGEMYFYLSMADQVIVGGGFTPHGAHNISEALALSKPVIVGPSIWTIEYPAFEAIEAGVLCRVDDQQTLQNELLRLSQDSETPGPEQVDQFFSKHTGAVEKTLAAIPELLSSTTSH